MRALVTVTVELVAEDGHRTERTLSSVTVSRERIVPVIPANRDGIDAAVGAAATAAVEDALAGTLAAQRYEVRA